MRCFDHPDTEAVGLCKSCGKGLCATCAADLDDGLACRERCEQAVRDLIALTRHSLRFSQRSANVVGASRRALMGSAWLLITIGLATISAGAVLDALLALGVLGGVCVVFGIILVLAARKMPTSDEVS